MKPYSYKRINIGDGEDDSGVETFTLPRSQPAQQTREVRATQSKRAPMRESYKLQQSRENFMHNNLVSHPANELTNQQFMHSQQAPRSFQEVQTPLVTQTPQPPQLTQELLKSELDNFMKGIKTICDDIKRSQEDIKVNVSTTKFRVNILMILIIVWLSFKVMMALLQILVSLGAVQTILSTNK